VTRNVQLRHTLSSFHSSNARRRFYAIASPHAFGQADHFEGPIHQQPDRSHVILAGGLNLMKKTPLQPIPRPDSVSTKEQCDEQIIVGKWTTKRARRTRCSAVLSSTPLDSDDYDGQNLISLGQPDYTRRVIRLFGYTYWSDRYGQSSWTLLRTISRRICPPSHVGRLGVKTSTTLELREDRALAVTGAFNFLRARPRAPPDLRFDHISIG